MAAMSDVASDGRFGRPPVRSFAQQMDALNRGNEIRSYRATLKKDVKAGRRSALDVLLEPPAEVETMKVCDLLLAVPKFGRVKVNRTLARERISPSKTVGGMSLRQRTALAAALVPYR